jgi:NAD dependent epimerase/dehydratase family
MATILITGCEGLVGRVLRPCLAAQDHEVIGLDAALPPDHPEHGDIVDGADVVQRCRRVDGIIHLAGAARPSDNLCAQEERVVGNGSRRNWHLYVVETAPEDGAQGRNRTTDTRIFSPLLYRLSYLGAEGESYIEARL